MSKAKGEAKAIKRDRKAARKNKAKRQQAEGALR